MTATSHTESSTPLPVFLNPGAGSATIVTAALGEDPRVRLHALEPMAMKEAIQTAVKLGAPRVIVSGGDGTIALAASCLAGSDTELAVLPGGTLNHFAGRMKVPDGMSEALELAICGSASPVDIAYVNDRLFINTSAIGAYVSFVRSREYLEKRMSYTLASLIAGLRRLSRLRSAHMTLDGKPVRSPLVFIGLNQREVKYPYLGSEAEQSEAGLHLLVARTETRLGSVKLAFASVLRGIDPLEKSTLLETHMVTSIDINVRRNQAWIAVDGELVKVDTPLRYRHVKNAIRVVQGPLRESG